MMRPPRDRLHRHSDHHSTLLHDLSTLVLNLLRSPPYDSLTSSVSSSTITPAGLASLMLGMSLTLMLCGSLTFFIGFLLMPWVLGLVMFLYVAGIVSALSFLGRSIVCLAAGPPHAPKHDMDVPWWKLVSGEGINGSPVMYKGKRIHEKAPR